MSFRIQNVFFFLLGMKQHFYGKMSADKFKYLWKI